MLGSLADDIASYTLCGYRRSDDRNSDGSWGNVSLVPDCDATTALDFAISCREDPRAEAIAE